MSNTTGLERDSMAFPAGQQVDSEQPQQQLPQQQHEQTPDGSQLGVCIVPERPAGLSFEGNPDPFQHVISVVAPSPSHDALAPNQFEPTLHPLPSRRYHEMEARPVQLGSRPSHRDTHGGMQQQPRDPAGMPDPPPSPSCGGCMHPCPLHYPSQELGLSYVSPPLGRMPQPHQQPLLQVPQQQQQQQPLSRQHEPQQQYWPYQQQQHMEQWLQQQYLLPSPRQLSPRRQFPLQEPQVQQPPLQQPQLQQPQLQQSPLQQPQLQQSPRLQYSPLQQAQLQYFPVQQSPLQQPHLQQSPLQQSLLQQTLLQQSLLQQPHLHYSPLQHFPLRHSPLQYSPVSPFQQSPQRQQQQQQQQQQQLAWPSASGSLVRFDIPCRLVEANLSDANGNQLQPTLILQLLLPADQLVVPNDPIAMWWPMASLYPLPGTAQAPVMTQRPTPMPGPHWLAGQGPRAGAPTGLRSYQKMIPDLCQSCCCPRCAHWACQLGARLQDGRDNRY